MRLVRIAEYERCNQFMVFRYPNLCQCLRILIQEGGKTDETAAQTCLVGSQEHVLCSQAAVQQVHCSPFLTLLNADQNEKWRAIEDYVLIRFECRLEVLRKWHFHCHQLFRPAGQLVDDLSILNDCESPRLAVHARRRPRSGREYLVDDALVIG